MRKRRVLQVVIPFIILMAAVAVPPGVYLVRGGLNLDPPNAGPPGVVITTAEKVEVLK